MDSIYDIKQEIKKLTEAIKKLTENSSLQEESVEALASLSYQLTEKIHLLKFAYSVFERETTEVLPKPATAPVENEGIAKTDSTELEEEPVQNIEQEMREASDEEEQENFSEEEPSTEVKEEDDEEPTSEGESEEEKPEEQKTSTVQDESSLNDKISRLSKSDLGSQLQQQPIDNLKRAIGLNDRFLFANELFHGDGEEYQRAIEEFNHLSSMEDAMRLIDHKYKEAYKWDFDSETVITFISYLQRRYNFRNSA